MPKECSAFHALSAALCCFYHRKSFLGVKVSVALRQGPSETIGGSSKHQFSKGHERKFAAGLALIWLLKQRHFL